LRRISSRLITILCAFSLTGCNYNTSNDLSEPLTQSENADDFIEEVIDNLTNISLSKTFHMYSPDESCPLFTFQRGIEKRLPSDIQLKNFKQLFSYLFPNAPFDEDAVYFVGDRYITMRTDWDEDYTKWLNWQNEQMQKGEWDELTPDFAETHPFPDPPDYNSFRDELLSGKESVQYFYYDYYRSELKDSRKPLFLEVSSPVGSDLFRFNRASFIQNNFSGELPFLETLTPDLFSEFVDSFPPDSNETFSLADGNCAICDAVDFFEEYINNIPLQQDSTFDITVMKVNVLKDRQDNYLYWFVCTPQYQGIPFDYRDISAHSQQGITRGETGITSIISGCMIESDSIEYLDGLLRISPLYSVQPVTGRISASKAIRIISENLSDNVLFRADSIELVYSVKQTDQLNDITDIRLDTKPTWKCTLYNTNDHQYYVCFVNADNGYDFRYYTYGEME